MIYKLMSARNVARAPVQRLLSYFYYKACSIISTLLQIFKSSLLNVPLNHKKSRVKINVPFSINSTLLKNLFPEIQEHRNAANLELTQACCAIILVILTSNKLILHYFSYCRIFINDKKGLNGRKISFEMRDRKVRGKFLVLNK